MTTLSPPDISLALFLDFDGTLAPICENPAAVRLPPGGADTLRRLSLRFGGAIAIISGRDIRDLALRVPKQLWRIGGHGLDICKPRQPPPLYLPEVPAELLKRISCIIDRYVDIDMEIKGPVVAIHYRRAPHLEEELRARIGAVAAQASDYVLQSGKKVIELKPREAHKGEAIRSLMKISPFRGRRPLMIGDDVTDEDAMIMSLQNGGYAVKVGEGNTVAPVRLEDPAAVWRWLEGAAA